MTGSPAPGPSAHFAPGVALVVGGSGGVGAGICLALAREGLDIALTYHGNLARAEEVAASVAALGRHAEVHQLDAGDESAVERLLAGVASRPGGLQVLVYAAGPLVPQIHLSRTTPDQMRRHLNADALGFFNLCHFAIPHLRQTQGSVVAVQSAAQFRWATADGLSVVPKAAVHAVMKGVAKEEGRFGIRANGVALGIIETGSHSALIERGDIDADYMAAAVKNIPLRSMGAPEDVAEAVLWLASKRARYVTGQVICVDGGYHL